MRRMLGCVVALAILSGCAIGTRPNLDGTTEYVVGLSMSGSGEELGAVGNAAAQAVRTLMPGIPGELIAGVISMGVGVWGLWRHGVAAARKTEADGERKARAAADAAWDEAEARVRGGARMKEAKAGGVNPGRR